jgi:hypothetical protein
MRRSAEVKLIDLSSDDQAVEVSASVMLRIGSRLGLSRRARQIEEESLGDILNDYAEAPANAAE